MLEHHRHPDGCPFKVLCQNFLGAPVFIDGYQVDACKDMKFYTLCGEYEKLLNDKEYHQKRKAEAVS